MKTFCSDISGVFFPVSEKISAASIRKSLLLFIRETHPEFSDDKVMSLTELNNFREQYISHYIAKQIGELTTLEKTVLNSIAEKTTLTDKLDDEKAQQLTRAQRIADHVAGFGGSWKFILSFAFLLVAWILINTIYLANKGFDPYPFILLNLILSCVAALQAPIIMMSQNRQEEKDRERAKKDYMINLKAEIEISTLHEKIDHLIMHQQQELLELQRVQIEMMNDILERVGKVAT